MSTKCRRVRDPRTRLVQEGQCLAAACVDFQGKQGIGAGAAQGDSGNRFAGLRRGSHEAVAGVDHQRGTHHQHRVGSLPCAPGGFHAFAWYVFAEEHHIGLHDAAAMKAGRHVEACEVLTFQIGVAIRRIGGIQRYPGRIALDQHLLERMTGQAPLAAHAAHFVETSVQVDHLLAAGTLVQAIHILCHQQFDLPAAFELGQRMMCAIRLRPSETPPADQAARPVALAGGRFVHEGGVVDRRCAFPLAVPIAIVGDARIGTASRAGQHEQARVGLDELLQRSHRPYVVPMCREKQRCRVQSLKSVVPAELRRVSRAVMMLDNTYR